MIQDQHDQPEDVYEGKFGKAERIRHYHKTCKLLSAESTLHTAGAHAADDVAKGSSPRRARPHALVKLLAAAVVALLGIGALIAATATRDSVRLVPDYRIGIDYRDAVANDAMFEPVTGRVMLATQGGGVHALDSKSGFFTHYTDADGLLSDQVTRLDRDGSGSVYFLCEQDQARGLCRLHPETGAWRTLLGLSRLETSTDTGDPARLSAAAEVEDHLWVATLGAGIGVYDPAQHHWVSQWRADDTSSLADNEVHDLLRVPDGDVWIATASGLSRYSDGNWQSWADAESLVGTDVRRLHWHDNKLWYITGGGGLGTFDGKDWGTVVAESSWESIGDADVRQVTLDPRLNHLWLTSARGSVGRYNPQSRQWTGFDPAPAGQTIHAVAVSPSSTGPRLRAATSDGVLELDPETGQWKQLGLTGSEWTQIDSSESTTVALAAAGEQRGSQAQSWVDQTWRRLVGPGRAANDALQPRSVASDGNGTLYLGSDSGVSTYNEREHDWIGHHVIPRIGSEEPSSIADLQSTPFGLVALTDDHRLASLDPAGEKMSSFAGGGEVAGDIADIRAVTRSHTGQLWVAMTSGLFTYDPKTHRWSKVESAPGGITQLAASKAAVWMLTAKGLFASGDDESIRSIPDLTQLRRVFASPDSDGAVVFDSAGRVFLISDSGQRRVVVGLPARELDLRQASVVGVMGDTLVVGGPRPHTYDTRSRSWSELKIGEVVQIESGRDSLWLRTKTGGLFRWTEANQARQQFKQDVKAIAAAGQRVAVLGEDGSIRELGEDGTWRTSLGPGTGPEARLLSSPNLLAEAIGHDLYLAGGRPGELWRYRWDDQEWQKLAGPSGAALGQIEAIESSQDRLFVRSSAGALYSISPGEAECRIELQSSVEKIKAFGDLMTVTAAQDAVVVREDKNWLRPFLVTTAKSASDSAAADTLRQVAPTDGGIVVAGRSWSALLSDSLDQWMPVQHNGFEVGRLMVGPEKSTLWATSPSGQLARFAVDGPVWEPIDFGSPSPVVSATIGSGPEKDQQWVCLENGAVYRVTGQQPQAIRPANEAPANLLPVAAVLPFQDRFLVASRGGGVAAFAPGLATWESLEPTGSPAIHKLLPVGPPAAPRSYWALGSDGRLSSAAAGNSLTWRPVAEQISDIAVSGQTLFAASTSASGLLHIDPTGRVTRMTDGGLGKDEPIGRVSAAAELVSGDGRHFLVLSDGQKLWLYDPARRGWFTSETGARDFHRTADGLVAIGSDGRAMMLRYNGQLQTTPINLPGTESIRIVEIAGHPDVRDVVMKLDDGRVAHVREDGSVRWLVGRSVAAVHRGSAIAAAAAADDHLVLALKDGSVHQYERQARNWRTVVPRAGAPRRIAIDGETLWIESDVRGQRMLAMLRREDGGWKGVRIDGPLVGWHRAPSGVVMHTLKDGTLATRYISSQGNELKLAVSPPPDAELLQAGGAPIVTSDGARTFVASSKGIAVLDREGKQLALSPETSIARFLWDLSNARLPRLLAEDSAGNVLRWSDAESKLQKAKPSDKPAGATFAGRACDIKLSQDGLRATIQSRGAGGQSDQAPTWTIDLKAGGLLRDRVTSMAISPGSVWLASDDSVERTSHGGNGAAQRFKIGAGTVDLQPLGGRLIAKVGQQVLELQDGGPPQSTELTPDERARLESRLHGERWRIASNGAMSFLAGRGDLLSVTIDPRRGLGVDIPHRLAISDQTMVVITSDGSYRVTLDATGRLPLDRCEPIESPTSLSGNSARELWASPDEVFWARDRDDRWFRLQEPEGSGGSGQKALRWNAVGSMPAATLAQYNLLCETEAASWVREGTTLQLREKAGSAELVSQFDPQANAFPAERVLAAHRTGDNLSLLTGGGLRVVDLRTGRLLAADGSSPMSGASAAQFRWDDDRWTLRIEKAGQPASFVQVGNRWQPGGDESGANQIVRGRLRVDRSAGEPKFAIRQSDDAWQPVAFDNARGRFDFQMASDAVATPAHLFTVSPRGVVVWTRQGNQIVYQQHDTGLARLGVSGDRTVVYAEDAAGQRYQFDPQRGWAKWNAAREDAAVLADNGFWRCRRIDRGGAIIEVERSGQWALLPLADSDSGGFAYRRARSISAAPSGGYWTMTPSLAVWMAGDDTLRPKELLKPDDLPAASGGFSDFFFVNQTAYLVAGESGWRLPPGKQWERADANEINESKRTLWEGPRWTWKVQAGGEPEIVQSIEDGDEISLTWDRSAGRFETDRCLDAALWKDAVWLASPRHLVRISTADLHASHALPRTQQPVDGRFRLARGETSQLLLASNDQGDRSIKVGDNDGKVTLARLADAAGAAQTFQSAYRDDQWQISGGRQGRIFFEGLPTGMSGGKFHHDRFSAIVASGETLWVATPAMLLRFDRVADQQGAARQWLVNDALPLPPDAPAIELLSVDSDGSPIVVDKRDGRALRWDAGGSSWQAQQDRIDRRLLADTPHWTWQRGLDGQVQMTLKRADRTTLEPLVTAEGQFPFDQIASILADDEVTWLATAEGIVARNSADGSTRFWYRSGITQEGPAPLGPIAAIQRFTDQGMPLPSSAVREEIENSTIMAINADQRVWEFHQGDPGHWQASDENPFVGPHGRWQVRTDFLEVTINSQQEIELAYPQATDIHTGEPTTAVGNVIDDGRFTIDRVRAVGWHEGSPFWATAAGIVKVDSEDQFENLWVGPQSHASSEVPGSPEDPEGTRDPRQTSSRHGDSTAPGSGSRHTLFLVDHESSGLVAVVDDASGYRWNQDQWEPLSLDASFREAANLMLANEFWTWSRWNDELAVTLHQANASGEHWPLFVNGRFCFDALQDFRIEEDRLWATTAGGVVQFDRNDMRILAIHRLAMSSETGEEVPLTAREFVDAEALECLDTDYRYRLREGNWRARRSHRVDRQGQSEYVDGELRWNVMSSQRGDATTGFFVEVYGQRGSLLDQREVLRGLEHDRLQRVVAADGKLWMCIDRGLYQIQPR